MATGNGEKMLWFVTGAGIGTGVAFLLWSRTGKRARRQVTRMMEDSCDRVVGASEDFLDRGKHLFERGKSIAGDAVHRVNESLHFAQQ